MPYFIYMLRCEDNSIYTGITTDINRRMNEHFSKNEKCAKYTLSHSAKELESVWETDNKILASKLEYHIKQLPKHQKEELIVKNNLEELLLNKVEPTKYKKMEIKLTEKLNYNITTVGNKKEDCNNSSLKFEEKDSYNYKNQCQKCGLILPKQK